MTITRPLRHYGPAKIHATDVGVPASGPLAISLQVRVIIAAFVAAFVTTCIWLSDPGLIGARAQIIGVTASLTALGLLGAVLMSRGQPLRRALAELQLGPWMGIGFSIGYGVATMVWWQGDLNYRGIVTSLNLAAGAVTAGIGFAAASAGYLLVPAFMARWASKMGTRIRGPLKFRDGPLSVWLLFGVALIGHALSLESGTFGYLSDPSAALSTTSSVAAVSALLTQLGVLATLVAAWRFATSRAPGAVVLLLIVATSQIAIGLFSGVKQAGIVQLIAVVLGLSAGGRLKVRTVLGAALLTLFVISPLVTAYRQELVVGTGGRLTASQVLERVDFANVVDDALGANAVGGTANANGLDRWSRIGDVAIIVNQSPSPVPFVSPVELLVGPALGFIPRSIWPGKPVLDSGYQVNQIYYHSSASIYSSAAPTPYGDLYRHGGSAIVLLGMAALGGLIRLVDSHGVKASADDPRVLFLPMLLFPAVVKQEIDFLGLTASLVMVVVAYVVACRLTATRRKE